MNDRHGPGRRRDGFWHGKGNHRSTATVGVFTENGPGRVLHICRCAGAVGLMCALGTGARGRLLGHAK